MKKSLRFFLQLTLIIAVVVPVYNYCNTLADVIALPREEWEIHKKSGKFSEKAQKLIEQEENEREKEFLKEQEEEKHRLESESKN